MVDLRKDVEDSPLRRCNGQCSLILNWDNISLYYEGTVLFKSDAYI